MNYQKPRRSFSRLRSSQFFRGKIAAAVLTIILPIVAGASPAPVYVFFGPVDKDSVERYKLVEPEYATEFMSQNYGLVGGLLSSITLSGLYKQYNRTTMVALDKSNVDNFAQRIAESWGCFGADGACRSVVVFGPDGIVVNEGSAIDVDDDGPIAAISIHVYLSAYPFIEIGLLERRGKNKLVRTEKINLWYWDAPRELSEDQWLQPFYRKPDKPKKKEIAQLDPLRAVWFEGNPSPLDEVIDGLITSVPNVLDAVYKGTETSPNGEISWNPWFKALPAVKPYAEQYGMKCWFDTCKNRMIKIGENGQDHWIINKYGPDMGIRVFACHRMWCD